jgi:sarcosine oxidase, subunit beta
MDSLPERGDVVVIGGGIVGASIVFHLAEAGIRDVVLLERGDFACGSSGKPIGGVRAQLSDALNIRLAARSLAAYERFDQTPGANIGLDQVGYLFLLRTAAEVAQFERSTAIQNELGVDTRLLSPAEAAVLCPCIDQDEFLAAAFSASDGHARPTDAAIAYVIAARSLGAKAVSACSVTDVDVQGGEITAVHTTRGSIRTPVVICAGGPWSREIGAMVGVDLDVLPIRQQIAFADRLPSVLPRLPFTIDYGSTFYFHSADDGVLLGMSDRDQPAGFHLDYSPRLAACPARPGRELRADPRRSAGETRLGRPVRDDPGRERAHRGGLVGQPLPLRDRVLRPRLLPSAGRG